MSNFLEKLKQIGIDLSKLEKISLFNLSINIDKSVRVEGNSVTVNPEKLNGKQRRALKELVRNHALDEAGLILDLQNVPLVEDVKQQLPQIRDSADKFQNIIPSKDVPLLKACIYLRSQFQVGKSVDSLKSQIVAVYGQRGSNLANLCSAGYLESLFWPLYQELLKSTPETAHQTFLELYDNVVSNSPWTEFVTSPKSVAWFTQHIIDKMRRNRSMGVNYMCVHGLGPKKRSKSEIHSSRRGTSIGSAHRED